MTLQQNVFNNPRRFAKPEVNSDKLVFDKPIGCAWQKPIIYSTLSQKRDIVYFGLVFGASFFNLNQHSEG